MTKTSEISSTSERTRWSPIIALAMAMLVVTSDMTIAAVTLPSLGAEFDVGPAGTAWVLLGYALPMAAVAIPAGRWVDRADLRAVFLFSMTGVAFASVLAAVAPSFWVLVVARFVQGFTGALTMSVYMPIVAATVSSDRRGRAIGYVVTIMTVGGLIGTPLGGLVAGSLGWRAVFLLKIPVVLIAVILALRSVPVNGKRLPMPDFTLWRDILVVGGAVGGLVLAFDRVADRPLLAAGLIAVAVVLAVTWLRFNTSRPLIAVIGRRELGLPMLGLFLVSCTIGLIAFLLPYYFTDVLKSGPATMGFALLFFTGAMVPVSPIAGNLADRFGALRVALAGVVVAIAGLGSFLTLGPESSTFDVIWRLVLLGLGNGLFNGPINAALMAATPSDMLGTAGGLFATTRTLASTVVPAVTALVWSLAGGGVAGFIAGVVVLMVMSVAGFGFMLAGRPKRAQLTRND